MGRRLTFIIELAAALANLSPEHRTVLIDELSADAADRPRAYADRAN